jgi:CheY-like chemotaxis protein
MHRILIIDRNQDFREILAEILEAEGVEVRYQASLDVSSVTSWAPVVALVATSLLEELSLQTLRASLPSLRYVVGMASDRQPQPTASGCDRIVIKPFDAAALLRRIDEHLANTPR